MRLKTKLVLAIAGLVFLISGALSLVYVSQLLHAAVQQSYDTDKMVANQVRFALQNALETGLKDRKVDPNNQAELRNLASRFLRQQVFSYFEDSGERLERIEAEAKKLSGAERDQALARIKLLKSWVTPCWD